MREKKRIDPTSMPTVDLIIGMNLSSSQTKLVQSWGLVTLALSLPLVHPNSVVLTTVLSTSTSQWLARSQSCNWIHRPQKQIISSWSWKPKRHETENSKHEHSHLQYCICNSNFNNTICSFYNAQMFRICPHQNIENIWVKKIVDHLHSVA